ncbi:hypothetical protein ABBQ32_001120 [Trebouxia sp. C0010 RCD-2024]
MPSRELQRLAQVPQDHRPGKSMIRLTGKLVVAAPYGPRWCGLSFLHRLSMPSIEKVCGYVKENSAVVNLLRNMTLVACCCL